MPLKVGDTVKLKSGGPLMTVEEFNSAKVRWICVWFDNAEQKRGEYLEATLEPATKPGAAFVASLRRR